ncbi:hypothetical protein [Ulvibacterium marinum]|uniref:Uncharacterized protein n=1 Tax=Ulvibacterium marinum TaxID=2419782 RepID=A0A3B0C8K9_9FLAO|nr:hypothetical protein [Ulvibacterium marinum]RKN82405.1 hypothetical protein D7Z94_00695 [Ulvibacterium marinum]
MRYLPISLLFLIWACASYPERNNFQSMETSGGSITNPYFSNPKKDYVYKADINLYKKNFSGILILKKLGVQHHRVVFTTELGNTIFDFSFRDGDFRVNHILSEMNKKMVINLLKKDFRTLVTENPSVLNRFASEDRFIFETEMAKWKNYYYTIDRKLEKIVQTKNGKKKVSFIFSSVDAEVAKNIQILHHNIKLSIRLKAI